VATNQHSQLLPCAFFERPVLEVARDLLGCTLLCDGVGGRLVEVEAYRSDDPASHSYRGRTPRNAVMYGPPGRLYVYFTMGLHFCVNIVCGPEGQASAVLLRALEPAAGLELMRARRGFDDPRRLCSGPAKLTQALAITMADNGAPACVGDGRFAVLGRDGKEATPRGVATPRIGVGAGAETLWRFVDADSAFLSRPLPAALRRPPA
jgi:DNA-3-methyladenine glycosylase